MPIVVSALKTLIETKIDTAFQSVGNYSGPLSQQNPSYFQEMCLAVSTGFASQPTIMGMTDDTGLGGQPPVVGTGVGVGLSIDRAYFEEQLYTTIRNFILSDFGMTVHPAYGPDNFLKAFCQGLTEAVEEYYQTAWMISSTHPMVYQGQAMIAEGNLSGLVSSTIQSTIISTASTFVGSFWPKIAESIATVYVDVIHNHTTNFQPITISGVCVASMTQVCAVPTTGMGTATIT